MGGAPRSCRRPGDRGRAHAGRDHRRHGPNHRRFPRWAHRRGATSLAGRGLDAGLGDTRSLRARGDPRARVARTPTPRDGRGRRPDRGAVHAHVCPPGTAGPDPGRHAVLAGPTRNHPGRDPRSTRPPADPMGWVVRRWSCDASPDGHTVRDRPLHWLADSGLRDAAREAASGPLADEKVLVHGDYQHFNVLWCDGRLTGVVDWPNAATGNRGSDVGHCRLNLAVLFDSKTAGDYLVMYEAAAGVRVDRRADLRALLCFDLEWQRFVRARSPVGSATT